MGRECDTAEVSQTSDGCVAVVSEVCGIGTSISCSERVIWNPKLHTSSLNGGVLTTITGTVEVTKIVIPNNNLSLYFTLKGAHLDRDMSRPAV